MKKCSKCGSEINEEFKYCEHCGQKLEETEIRQEGDNQNKILKNINNNKNANIIRYCIGGLFLVGGLTSLPTIEGFFAILFGISIMPIVYKVLSDKKNINFKGIQIIIPVVLFILFGLTNSISNRDYTSNENFDNDNDIQASETTDNNESNNENQTLEEKWEKYYKDNNIDVIEVDSETLHNYGTYYKNKTILTGITIEDKTSKSIKAKIGDSESIYYSFVFNFEDNSEIKKYNKGDKIIVVGEVSKSTNDKTVTLNNCHIISSNTKAQSKIEELSNNKTQYTEYIISIKEEQDRKGDIGDAYIEILDTKVINSYGKNVVLVSLLFKNNSDENKSFNYTADVKVFQSGIELESSIMKCSWYDSNYEDNGDVEIKPGVTVTVNKCFLTNDVSSDVEVNVEAWMFSSLYKKLNKTFKLG